MVNLFEILGICTALGPGLIKIAFKQTRNGEALSARVARVAFVSESESESKSESEWESKSGSWS